MHTKSTRQTERVRSKSHSQSQSQSQSLCQCHCQSRRPAALDIRRICIKIGIGIGLHIGNIDRQIGRSSRQLPTKLPLRFALPPWWHYLSLVPTQRLPLHPTTNHYKQATTTPFRCPFDSIQFDSIRFRVRTPLTCCCCCLCDLP